MTKVVQIQSAFDSGGRSAIRLQKLFEQNGIQSKIICLHKHLPPLQNVEFLSLYKRLKAKFNLYVEHKITNKIPKKFGLYSISYLGTDLTKNKTVIEADVIYLHWINNGFLSLGNLKSLLKLGKPVVITMHDMWWITGGCHYSFECSKFTLDCKNCELFAKNKSLIDWPARSLKIKKQLYSEFKNLYFVSPSIWLSELAKKSVATSEKPIFYIPNALDPTYRKMDKASARHLLNLPGTAKIICFSAYNIISPYKGWNYFLKALQVYFEKYERKNVFVLVMGSGHEELNKDEIPFPFKFLGFLQDTQAAATVYSAADVFVVSSLADNLPTTIQESLSCGTPVVGFNKGGIPDMIKHKTNGYLAEYLQSDDIADGINFCIENNLVGAIKPQFYSSFTFQKHQELISLGLNESTKTNND
jgi:glycosyltransferase involved in cell wall biosynthesis